MLNLCEIELPMNGIYPLIDGIYLAIIWFLCFIFNLTLVRDIRLNIKFQREEAIGMEYVAIRDEALEM